MTFSTISLLSPLYAHPQLRVTHIRMMPSHRLFSHQFSSYSKSNHTPSSKNLFKYPEIHLRLLQPTLLISKLVPFTFAFLCFLSFFFFNKDLTHISFQSPKVSSIYLSTSTERKLNIFLLFDKLKE